MNSTRKRFTASLTSVVLAAATIVAGAAAFRADAGRGHLDPSGDQFFSTVREEARGLDHYTVFRPAEIESFAPRSLPVVVWGNGGCDQSHLAVISYLSQIAAAGYVVVSVGGLADVPDGTGSAPDALVDAIDWVETSAAKTQLRHRIDTDKIATMGRSCGGLQALLAGTDERVGSVAALHSGYFPTPRIGFDPADLAELEAPTLWTNGGPEDVAYENSRQNFQDSPVPSVLVEVAGGGHDGVTFGTSHGEVEAEYLWTGVQVAVNWLDFTLNGDKEAGDFFLEPECRLCDIPDWSSETKGFAS